MRSSVRVLMLALVAAACSGKIHGGGGDVPEAGPGEPDGSPEAEEQEVVTDSVTGPPGFKLVHPGVLVSLDQLQYSRAKVMQGEDPWRATFEDMQASPLATRVPNTSYMLPAPDGSAGKIVDCNRDYAGNARGCKEESIDSEAAYTQALLWYYTRDETHAQRCIAILDAYSGALVDHVGPDASLFASWAAQYFVRAAEILRYTYTPSEGHETFDQARFEQMLDTAFLPMVRNDEQAKYGEGWWDPYNSNWDLAAIDALASIAVYKNDGAQLFAAADRWQARLPQNIYLTSDGPNPVPSTFIHRFGSAGCAWIENRVPACSDPELAQTVTPNYENGQNIETCRDFPHAGMSLGAMVNTAETAWIQGVDLYSLEKDRIMTAFSYAAQLLLYYEHNEDYPYTFCAPVAHADLLASAADPDGPLAPVNDGGRQLNASEIAYNAYVVRGGEDGFRVVHIPGYSTEGIEMYQVNGHEGDYTRDRDPLRTIIDRYRGDQGQLYEDHNAHISLWETLTHHLVGDGEPRP